MDKSTLSNYGWVVIAVLVLSVMIALATPFGDYIGNAVKSTTEGLFAVQQKAMGVAGLVVDDQSFEDTVTPVEYKLSGIWKFNDVISRPDYAYNENKYVATVNYNIHFVSNGETFIAISYDEVFGAELCYDTTCVFSLDTLTWTNQEYRNITFTSEQQVSMDFWNWFTANATKVG